jgi:hypothetical protein
VVKSQKGEAKSESGMDEAGRPQLLTDEMLSFPF